MAWGQEGHQGPDPRHVSEARENWTDARVTGEDVTGPRDLWERGVKGIQGAHSSTSWVGTLGTCIRAPGEGAAGTHVVC